MSEVVRANRETIKDLSKAISKDDVSWHFGHDVNLQTIYSPLKSVLSHDVLNQEAFFDGTANWDHDLEVLELHVIPDLSQSLTFKNKGRHVSWVIVATSTTPTDHWIRLFWFVSATTDEVSVFITLEVRETDDDVLRIESGSDESDTFGELINIELLFVFVADSDFVDLLLSFFVS